MNNEVAKCLTCSKPILGYIKKTFLMCGCCFAFCELNCYNKFLERIYEHLNFINQDTKPFSYNNNSKHQFSTEQLFEIIFITLKYYKIFEDEESKQYKKIFHNEIKKILTNKFDSICMYCKCDINESNSITVILKQKKKTPIYDIMESKMMTHKVCNKCLNNKTNKCAICCCYHYKVAT